MTREPGDPFQPGDVFRAADINAMNTAIRNRAPADHTHTLTVERDPTPGVVRFNQWATALALILAILLMAGAVTFAALTVIGLTRADTRPAVFVDGPTP